MAPPNLNFATLVEALAAAAQDPQVFNALSEPGFEPQFREYLTRGLFVIRSPGKPNIFMQPQPGISAFRLIFAEYLYTTSQSFLPDQTQKSALLNRAAEMGSFGATQQLISNILDAIEPLLINQSIPDAYLNALQLKINAICRTHGTPGFITAAFAYVSLANRYIEHEDYDNARQLACLALQYFYAADAVGIYSLESIHNAYHGEGVAAGNTQNIASIEEAEKLCRKFQLLTSNDFRSAKTSAWMLAQEYLNNIGKPVTVIHPQYMPSSCHAEALTRLSP